MMRITKVRLVNFHNFVNETVDIEKGGHLFLLGDNGSGKTTVLDAVHYALSGGRLEFNAAARVGGNKEEGRSMQGVVLRQDFERGIQNEGGAIAYAAVELWDESTGKRLSVGVGTEATTMEARVSKWGFVVPGPVSELPLVVQAKDEDARFAATREALRSALGASKVFFRIGDYRAAMAARLFSSPGAYDDVCRFWQMAKAYREIVSGARNFGALFRKLLPAPDPKVFGEIARTLQNLGDMDQTIIELSEQRDYIAGLLELAREIDRESEVASRCRWLAGFRKIAETKDGIQVGALRTTELTSEISRLKLQVEAADAKTELAEAAVREAEAKDDEGLAAKLREAKARKAEALGEHAERERESERQTKLALSAKTAHEKAGFALAGQRRDAQGRLDTAISAASQLPGELPRARALSAAMDLAGRSSSRWGPGAWRDEVTAASAESSARVETARNASEDGLARLALAKSQREDSATSLADLRRQEEEEPRLENYTKAHRVLKSAGIKAQPVYELLEPKADAASEELASVEALVGDSHLAALVVDKADRERAAKLVVDKAPGVRVVVATSEVALPAWVAALFKDRSSEDLSATAIALGALACALAQPEDLGPLESPKGQELLHRGGNFASLSATPRLLGAANRRRAHQESITRVEAALHSHDTEVAAAETRASSARASLGTCKALVAAIALTSGADLLGAEAEHGECERSLKRESDLAKEASRRAASAGDKATTATSVFDLLHARAEAMHLDQLQKRIRELILVASQARKESKDLQARFGVCENDITRLAKVRTELEESLAELQARQEPLALDVVRRAALKEDASVEHYVRVEHRGDTFKSISTIESRVSDAERRIRDSESELTRDGARGVGNIHFAGRFGFHYDATHNRIVDRRELPAVGILKELERTLVEQRSVITTKTRELMETLVLGGLARDLQGQVDTLEELIKNINRLLQGIRFGRNSYQFRVAPMADRRALVEIVRRVSMLDPESGAEFRNWVEDRIDELRSAKDGEIPELFDYRNWFEYSLRMTTSDDEGVDLTRSVRALGSGGEQAVPNYLLVLALGKLMFGASKAKLSPLLFDEAFYGIDAGRRDQLLRFATELELQLLVASPDQDGVTASAKQATTLFIVKDDHGDVHLAPYHYWHRQAKSQGDLFSETGPSEPAPEDAECVQPES